MNRLNSALLSLTSSNIEMGMEAAKAEVLSTAKFLVNYVAVPLISATLIGFLVFFIAKAVILHRQGMGSSEKLLPIVAVVVGIALVASFPVWGWKLIGM